LAYAEVSGARIWYQDSGGGGDAVVFLHAQTGTADSWELQVAPIAAAGYRCITYDRSDTGRSRPAAGADPVRDHARELLELADILGLSQFHLIGTAAGAMIALDFARRWRGRLTSLVLASSIAGLHDDAFRHMASRLRLTELENLPVEVREVGPNYRASNAPGLERWMQIEATTGHPPRTQIGPFIERELHDLPVPVLVITGEADLYAPPVLMERLAGHLSNSTFVSIRGAGHSAFWEVPDEWNRHVLEFLSQFSSR